MVIGKFLVFGSGFGNIGIIGENFIRVSGDLVMGRAGDLVMSNIN